LTLQQSVFTVLTAILPVLGVILPGLIKSDGQSDQNNSLITFVILLFAGGAQAWSAGQINVNPWIDLLAVEAAMASILSGPFAPLDQWLQSNIGLGTTKSTPTAITQPVPVPPSNAGKPPA
jgi:hypothetical protein